jgi:hypothetical protein
MGQHKKSFIAVMLISIIGFSLILSGAGGQAIMPVYAQEPGGYVVYLPLIMKPETEEKIYLEVEEGVGRIYVVRDGQPELLITD